jgi:hypothetical protein
MESAHGGASYESKRSLAPFGGWITPGTVGLAGGVAGRLLPLFLFVLLLLLRDFALTLFERVVGLCQCQITRKGIMG